MVVVAGVEERRILGLMRDCMSRWEMDWGGVDKVAEVGGRQTLLLMEKRVGHGKMDWREVDDVARVRGGCVC